MDEKLVILVTGASRGIGKYLCEYYSDRGANVVGASRRKDIDIEPRPNFEYIPTDVTQEKAVVALFGEVRTRHKRLDVLINNAGVNDAMSLVALTSVDAARATFDTSMLGTFLCSREAVKLMMRRKFGRIVNFSSMAVRHEVVGESIYSAAKAAVQSFSRVLAKEVSEYGITCNVVAPSAIETDLTSNIDPEALDNVLQRNAINKLGELRDVSNTIDWLMRPESGAITGQIIYLGGA